MRDPSGNLVCDSHGNPVLRCFCGNVLGGRCDFSLPFYTPKGSFWTNSIGRLAAKIDRENRPDSLRRGHSGYESVALVPLRAGKQILGLLQCNDRREGRWTPAAIAVLEKLADALALAIGFLETRENLCAVHSELEQRVRERTAALLQSNEQLKREIQHRRRIRGPLAEKRGTRPPPLGDLAQRHHGMRLGRHDYLLLQAERAHARLRRRRNDRYKRSGSSPPPQRPGR